MLGLKKVDVLEYIVGFLTCNHPLWVTATIPMLSEQASKTEPHTASMWLYLIATCSPILTMTALAQPMSTFDLGPISRLGAYFYTPMVVYNQSYPEQCAGVSPPANV